MAMSGDVRKFHFLLKKCRSSLKSFICTHRGNYVSSLVIVFHFFFTFVSIASALPSRPESEIFSSTTELQKLYKHESEVVQKLQEYAEVLDKNLKVVQTYIEDFKKIDTVDKEDALEIVENPVNAYHVLKRTVIDWEVVAGAIKNHSDLVGEVMKKGERLPTFDDFIGGSNALVGLQDTYLLNLTEIIHGTLHVESSVQRSPYELSARDCLFLGKSAFNKGLYDRAIGWLEMALSRAQEESEDGRVLIPTATKEEILPYLESTKRTHDEILKERGPKGETWQTFEKPISGESVQYPIQKRYEPKIMVQLNTVEENENFKALCRGEYLRTPELDAPLRCRYLHRENSPSLIGPYKIEEHSIDPHIVVYHDFMSESEMGTFKEKAKSRLKRSLHQGRDGRYIATDIRTSKQAWLKKDDDPLIDIISRRIGDATNLEVFPEEQASEIYQVANYGMAGRYSPHTDYITGEDHLHNPQEGIRGNRIATFMVYLEDVPAGGSTVFPLIGVQVKPKKGSAVFWLNLRSDGRGDPWTRHAGCSVLYGNKWITNKWIRYHEQFRKFPCVNEPKNEMSKAYHELAY